MTHDLTLDPDDWNRFRALAHRMVDDMIDHLSTLAEQPAWRPIPAEVQARLDEPVPRQGLGEEEAYRSFLRDVLPYPNGNLHPRFFGWVQGNGTPLGMMADLLASGINPHLAGFDQAPARVEEQVLRWLAQLLGFPSDASGVLALGGSITNVLGLAVARHHQAGFDVRTEGLQSGPLLTVYGSTETHAWLGKAVELLGLGRRALRSIRTDRAGAIDVAALAEIIDADRRAGCRPICIVGTAG